MRLGRVVHGTGGLIGKHPGRPFEQHARNRQALLLTAREHGVPDIVFVEPRTQLGQFGVVQHLRELLIGIVRSRFRISQRVTQRTLRKIRSLRNEHRILRSLHLSCCERPDARKHTHQRGLSAARCTADQHAITGLRTQRGIRHDRIAVRQIDFQRRGLHMVAHRQRCAISRMFALLLEALVKPCQTLRGRAPCSDVLVVVHDPAQRIRDLPECRRNLHQLPKLDRAAEKARSGNDERKHHRSLTEESGEPDQAFLLADQRQIVAQHIAETLVQTLAFDALATIQRNRFGMLTHADHVVAKVGLELLLPVVEQHLRRAHPERDGRADDAVQHRHPHHEARDLPGATAQRLRHAHIHHTAQAPENAHKAHERDHRVEQPHGQRHGVGCEQIQVFLNALIGVVRHIPAAKSRQFQPIERLGRKPARQHLLGEPAPPVQLQQLREIELVDSDDDVDRREPAELPELLPEHVGLLVLQRIVEHAIPLVELHQHVDRAEVQGDDGDEQSPRLALLLRHEIRTRQIERLARDMCGIAQLLLQTHVVPCSGESAEQARKHCRAI